jgi:hypothetical protein
MNCISVVFSLWKTFFLNPIPPDIDGNVKFVLWKTFVLDPMPPDIVNGYDVKDEVLGWLDRKFKPRIVSGGRSSIALCLNLTLRIKTYIVSLHCDYDVNSSCSRCFRVLTIHCYCSRIYWNILNTVALRGLVILDGKICKEYLKNKKVGCESNVPYPHKLNDMTAVFLYDMSGSDTLMVNGNTYSRPIAERLVEKLLSVVTMKLFIMFFICPGKLNAQCYERTPVEEESWEDSISKRSKAEFFWKLWTCFELFMLVNLLDCLWRLFLGVGPLSSIVSFHPEVCLPTSRLARVQGLR